MRSAFGLVLLVGLALAGGAVYMARNYIAVYQAELARERAARAEVIPTIGVFVVNKHLKYGAPLAKEDVRLVKWPQESVPEGAFTDPALLFPDGLDQARVVIRTMEKDEPVLAVKVSAPGEDAGITSRLNRGMRAFAINVDVSSGVSGFLRPEDRVDVYWTGRLPDVASGGSGAQDVTRLIDSNIRLIAVDQTADGGRSQAIIARTVTVEVSPRQVAALAQAQSSGRLSLALVGANDTSISESIEINQRQLLGIKSKTVAKVVEEKSCSVRTRRGAEVVEIPIPCPPN